MAPFLLKTLFTSIDPLMFHHLLVRSFHPGINKNFTFFILLILIIFKYIHSLSINILKNYIYSEGLGSNPIELSPFEFRKY
jgi:hypothetical protein